MKKYFTEKLLRGLVAFLFLSLINTSNIYPVALRDSAETYREDGYKLQQAGDIDGAITKYQKATELDPHYAAPRNDLGILYEAKGWLDRAESEYLKALAVDPEYEKAHTNIALLYERQGEVQKAAYHWMRRYKLGKPDDPWTEEARKRLEKLGLVDKMEGEPERVAMPKEQASMTREFKAEGRKESPQEPEGWQRVGGQSDKPVMEKRQKEEKSPKVKKAPREAKKTTMSGMEKGRKSSHSDWTRLGSKKEEEKPAKRIVPDSDLSRELERSLHLAEQRLKEEKRVASRRKAKKGNDTAGKTLDVDTAGYYREANSYYQKGEYSRALDVIRKAKREEKVSDSLSELEAEIKNKMKEERIEDHYSEGMTRYRSEDYEAARKEFEAMLNILPE